MVYTDMIYLLNLLCCLLNAVFHRICARNSLTGPYFIVSVYELIKGKDVKKKDGKQNHWNFDFLKIQVSI